MGNLLRIENNRHDILGAKMESQLRRLLTNVYNSKEMYGKEARVGGQENENVLIKIQESWPCCK